MQVLPALLWQLFVQVLPALLWELFVQVLPTFDCCLCRCCMPYSDSCLCRCCLPYSDSCLCRCCLPYSDSCLCRCCISVFDCWGVAWPSVIICAGFACPSVTLTIVCFVHLWFDNCMCYLSYSSCLCAWLWQMPVQVLGICVRTQADNTSIASIKVPSIEDARYAISQFHRRKIGYKRINVAVSDDRDQAPAESTRYQSLCSLRCWYWMCGSYSRHTHTHAHM